MGASEWTAIGIFVAGLVVSLLVYIVQFLHRMDKRGAVDTAKIEDHGVRIGRLETATGEMRTSITKLEAKR